MGKNIGEWVIQWTEWETDDANEAGHLHRNWVSHWRLVWWLIDGFGSTCEGSFGRAGIGAATANSRGKV